MSTALLFGADLLAVAILTFALYFPRHRRRDLVAAFLGVNVGVLAVAGALSSSTVGAGLGLGLFGVLSIIRLRSSEISQHEIAYYFSALAIGLIGGLGSSLGWKAPALMALVLVALFVGDHPRLLRRYQQQVVVLDRAYGDRAALVARLEELLGAQVVDVTVHRLDLVDDVTEVDVRYRVDPAGRSAASGRAPTTAGGATSTAPAGTSTTHAEDLPVVLRTGPRR